ncbi:hypothetical protein A33M_1281 [Rhodovulum sp. PH10]|nr:hypothetical protein A33M_1281 [Rhodovulum sp. PH10]
MARSEASKQRFIERNPHIAEQCSFLLNETSYFEVINRVVEEAEDDFPLIVHDDLFFPKKFATLLEQLIRCLEGRWPNWGICGNSGMLAYGVGPSVTRVVRYISDPHGGVNCQGIIFPAQSIDGNVILLNRRRLRERAVVVPSFPGFQLYDLSLAVEVLRAGLCVLISPSLACHHDSGGSQAMFDAATETTWAKEYFSQRITNKALATINGCISLPFDPSFGSGKIDLEMQSLRNATIGRNTKKVAIVVRSLFNRPSLLRRALETVRSFVIAAGPAVRFEVAVATHDDLTPPPWVEEYAIVRKFRTNGLLDTRALLVRASVETIDADYFWFVDDDDWLFPNEAERIASILNISEPPAVVFMDSAHFLEEIEEDAAPIGGRYVGRLSRRFEAKNWPLGFGGANHIPFCGFVFHRSAIEDVPLDDLTLFEDYAIQLSALNRPECIQYTVEKLVAGISIRASGNTVTLEDRTAWDRCAAEVTSMMAARRLMPGIFALGNLTPPPVPSERPPEQCRLSRSEQKLLRNYRALKRGIQRVIDGMRRKRAKRRDGD